MHVKVNTCLDIIQDCTARCPEGIYSLWPWEMGSEQHICDIKTRRQKTRSDKLKTLSLHFRRVCWSKSRYLQKSWLKLHLSLSLGLMATREPRSQIAPNWPATELFKLTKGGFSPGLRVHRHGNAQQIIHLPGEVEQVTLVDGDIPIWALTQKQQSGLTPVLNVCEINVISSWGIVTFATHLENSGSRYGGNWFLNIGHVTVLKKFFNSLLWDLHTDHWVAHVCKPGNYRRGRNNMRVDSDNNSILKCGCC